MITRITKCVCGCTRTTPTPVADGWFCVPQRDRGGRVAYMCPTCAVRMQVYSYENPATRGKTGCGGGVTYSVEFETNAPTPAMQAYMLKNEWACTSDCTVDAEYKSPIFQSLNPLKKLLPTLEQMQAAGDFSVGSNCGTHFNVGIIGGIGYGRMEVVRRAYKLLFKKLSVYLAEHPEECAAVFGRPLNEWAAPIHGDNWCDAMTHTNFINLQHDTHIEFRVAKFCTAAQYMAMAKMCKAMVASVLKFTDTPTGRSGSKCAEKLVTIFQKTVASL